MGGISRRAVLLGGTGVTAATLATGGLLINEGVLPGRVRVYAMLGLNGDEAPIPDVTPGKRFDGSFDSRARKGATTNYSLSVPPGLDPDGLPLVVCLHGARADHRTAFTSLGVDRFLAQSVAKGNAPFALASVDGGPNSYWHRRADGTDSASMVLDELVPLLRDRYSLGNDLGLYGWSMGGYGVLRMAMRGAPVKAVVACSPALFESYADTPPGAFDSRADFDREGLRGQARNFPDVPLRIDCGNGDPFYFPVRDFVQDLRPQPQGGFEDGAHTYGYMRRMIPDEFAFLAQHLT